MERPTSRWRDAVAAQRRLLVHLVRWTVLGCVVGVLAGLSSALFLESLAWATRTR
jgi:hypothetical protein